MTRSFWRLGSPDVLSPRNPGPCSTDYHSFSPAFLPTQPSSSEILRKPISAPLPGLKVILLGSTRPSHVYWGQVLRLWMQTCGKCVLCGGPADPSRCTRENSCVLPTLGSQAQQGGRRDTMRVWDTYPDSHMQPASQTPIACSSLPH